MMIAWRGGGGGSAGGAVTASASAWSSSNQAISQLSRPRLTSGRYCSGSSASGSVGRLALYLSWVSLRSAAPFSPSKTTTTSGGDERLAAPGARRWSRTATRSRARDADGPGRGAVWSREQIEAGDAEGAPHG